MINIDGKDLYLAELVLANCTNKNQAAQISRTLILYYDFQFVLWYNDHFYAGFTTRNGRDSFVNEINAKLGSTVPLACIISIANFSQAKEQPCSRQLFGRYPIRKFISKI